MFVSVHDIICKKDPNELKTLQNYGNLLSSNIQMVINELGES